MNFAETLEPRRLLSGLTDAVTVDGTPTGENDVILGQTSNAVIFAHDNPRYGYEPTIFRGKDQISVIDANPGAGGSNPKPFAQAGNVLFFTTQSHDARLLWRTDGGSSNRTSRVHIHTSTPPVVAGEDLVIFCALV